MIDQSVQQFIEHVIDSPTKLHLLLLFHEHPALEITPSRMAERTCRDIWSVSQALHEMAEDGVLVIKHGSGEPHYQYRPRVDLVDLIGQLIRGYDDPLERDFLQRSIRDLASYASYRRSNLWEYQVAVV